MDVWCNGQKMDTTVRTENAGVYRYVKINDISKLTRD